MFFTYLIKCYQILSDRVQGVNTVDLNKILNLRSPTPVAEGVLNLSTESVQWPCQDVTVRTITTQLDITTMQHVT